MIHMLSAIITLTIKEAIRKKTFLILALFAVALISSSSFFPVLDKSSQIQLVEQWTLRSIILFASMIAIFTTATSLPSDIEWKRIHTLLSKPIGKSTILLGKFMGFTAVILMTVLLMGGIGYLYIIFIQGTGDQTKSGPLAAYPVFSAQETLVTNGTTDRDHKDNITYILGSPSGKNITWFFTHLDPRSFHEQFIVHLQFVVYTGAKRSADITVTFINPQNQKQVSQQIRVKNNKPVRLTCERTYISDQGKIMITASRVDPQSVLRGKEKSVLLFGKDTGFLWNFFKGLLLIFLQTLILMSATLMSSVFLSTPVAVFFGLSMYLISGMYGFWHDSLHESQKIVSFREKRIESGKHIHQSPSEINHGLVTLSNTISSIVLQAIPDFRMFDFSSYLLSNSALRNHTVWTALLHALAYSTLFLILGFLFMIKKDFT